MSGRRPAYVPTTSSRVRFTVIVALTVSSSLSTSQPAAVGWAAGPSNGASVVPISQCSPHGTRNTILPGTRIVSPVLLGIRSRRTTRWAPRLGRMRSDPDPSGWSGSAAHTPRRVDDRARRDLEVAAVEQVRGQDGLRPDGCPGSVRTPVARTRVSTTAPAAIAVLATASV